MHLRHARGCQRLGVDVLELLAHARSAPELSTRKVKSCAWVGAQQGKFEGNLVLQRKTWRYKDSDTGWVRQEGMRG